MRVVVDNFLYGSFIFYIRYETRLNQLICREARTIFFPRNNILKLTDRLTDFTPSLHSIFKKYPAKLKSQHPHARDLFMNESIESTFIFAQQPTTQQSLHGSFCRQEIKPRCKYTDRGDDNLKVVVCRHTVVEYYLLG